MAASDQRFYFLLQLAAHRMKKVADATLAEAAGLSTAQAAVLAIIADQGPVSQRYVADQLSQRESAVMTMTNRLMKAEYVVRQRSAEDARAWSLTVTDNGREALANMKAPFADLNRLIDESLGTEEVDRLSSSLRTLLSALKH